MPHPKPPCPKCGDTTHVMTLGGGSLGQYRYICNDVMCKAEWQQVPLHKLAYNERPNPIMKRPRKKRSDAKTNQIVHSASEVTEDLSFLIPVAPATVAMTTETEKRDGVVGDVMISIDDLGRTGPSRGA